MKNSDMIAISQIDNESVLHKSNYDLSGVESLILFNLARNTAAEDISINSQTVTSDISFQDTSLLVRYPDSQNLKNHVVINNTDDYLTSEKFAMNIQYLSNLSVNTPQQNDFVIVSSDGSTINSDIKLQSGTVSYFDSNLKVDVSLNNNDQKTTDNNWKVKFDRRYNNMNYFAAVNSNLNEASNKYPFTITEDVSNNAYSLFKNGIFFTGGSNNTNDPSFLLQRTAIPFSTIPGLKSLSDVKLDGILNDSYQYTDDNGKEFGTYKFERVRDVSSLSVIIRDLSSGLYYNKSTGLPIGTYDDDINAANGFYSSDIFDNYFTMPQVIKNVNKFDPSNSDRILDGFTATLDIGDVIRGGYTIPENQIIKLDDSQLTTDGSYNNVNYFTNNKPRGSHRIDISNGRTIIHDNGSYNETLITLSTGAESLDSSFNTRDGRIVIKSGAILAAGTSASEGARAVFNYNKDSSGNPTRLSNGSFTENVSVYYNNTEAGAAGKSSLSGNVLTSNYVNYDLKLLIESTDPISSNTLSTYTNTEDSRNICQNSLSSIEDKVDTVLVMASPIQPIGFNLAGSNFTISEQDSDNKIRTNGKISILNIKHNDKILENGLLFSGLDVSDTAINSIRDSNC
jgi:hypothetical protein